MSHGIDYGYFGCLLGLGSFILDGSMSCLLEFYIGWSIFFILKERCMMVWGFIGWILPSGDVYEKVIL